MKKVILILFLTLLIPGCKSTKHVLFQNHDESSKKIIDNNLNYKNAKLILKIKPYVLLFDIQEFEGEISKINDEMPTIVQGNLKIEQTKNGLILNDVKILNTLESTGINLALDNLYSKGKFYLSKNGNANNTIKYEYCKPKLQGEIYSNWIVNETIIKKISWGFTN